MHIPGILCICHLLVRVDVHQLTHDTHLAAALPGLARHHHLLRRKGRGGALPPYPIPARPHTHTHHQHNPTPMAASRLERLKVTKGAKRVEVEVGDRQLLRSLQGQAARRA